MCIRDRYSEDADGNRFVYDVNTNTNYNSGAETEFGGHRQGMFEIARFLGEELEKVEGTVEKKELVAV